MTLLAMERNQYTLRNITTEEGIVAYFEAADRSHQVAVRHKPLEASPSTMRWEMVAETFNLYDESCLFVLDDFVCEAEQTGLGELELPGELTYPKEADNKGVLRPPSQVKESFPGILESDPERLRGYA
jgi:hypothetical protein